MSEHKRKESSKNIGFKNSILTFFKSESSNSLSIPFLLICIVVFSVYANAIGNGFVWDDVESIQQSPILHSFENIPKIFSDSMNLIYRPLVYSTYIFIYEIFGGNAYVFHAFNIMIHLLVSLLAFILFRKFFDPRIALLITLLFSAHPVNVEAVTWISAYSELSYVLFGMLSLLMIIRFAEEKNKIISLIFSSVFIFMGYLSKESTIIFSGLLILYLVIFARKKTIWGILAMGIPTILYFFIRFFVIEGVFYSEYEKFIVPIQNLPLLERILHIPSILFYYIITFFVPISLHIEQYWIHETFGFGNFILPLIIVIAFAMCLLVLGLRLLKMRSELFSIFLLFSGGLFMWSLMHIQILPLTMTVAERWLYGAGIFMLGIVGIVLTILEKKPAFKTLIIFLLMILALFSIRTVVRNRDWKNNMTLYSHDYKIDPNYALENNYGSELFNSGRRDEAYPHVLKSVELKPDWWRNWTNLGVYYEQKGEIDNAIASYQKSIKNNPGYAIAYVRLASIYLFSQQMVESEKYVKEGLLYNPENAELVRLYAFILYGSKRKDEAVKVMERAYMLDPSPQNKQLLDGISKGKRIQINK